MKVIWTNQAQWGLEQTVQYLQKHWTDKELEKFEKRLLEFLERIRQFPEICPPSLSHSDLRRGVLFKHNYIVYKVDKENARIVIINFRGTRQEGVV